MLKRSSIGWCDYSGGDLNFVIGCAPISEGCENCYARAWAKRAGRQYWDVVQIYRDKLNRLWKAKWNPGDRPYRRGPGSKPIMFPVDLGDLFHPDVPSTLIQEALDVFKYRDDADWVLLTKRPERMLRETEYWMRNKAEGYEHRQLPPNIWCMVTAENQKWADIRIPVLLQVRAQVLGVSLEPMLEPISLMPPCLANNSLYKAEQYAGKWNFRGERQEDGSVVAICDNGTKFHDGVDLRWVICGAESGPDRRPFGVAWAEDIYRQCQAAGVPFFGKQDSGLRPGVPLLIDGSREIKEFPYAGV